MSGTSVWFRFYNNAMHDPKVQKLPGEKFKAWVNFLCLASEKGGVLPCVQDISYMLRMEEEVVSNLLDEFYRLGLFDEVEQDDAPISYTPHNWGARQYKSDVSTDRVKRFRDKQREQKAQKPETLPETQSETFHETQDETLITEQSKAKQNKNSRSVADATRPSADAFEEFWKSFPRREGPNPRKPAEQKFNALVKTGVDPAVMIAGAKQLAADEGKRGNIGTRFIPQAVTWLNQQRWADHAVTAFEAEQPAPGFYAKFGSEEQDAWDAYGRAKTGKAYPRDSKGGWRHPTQWPPGYEPQQVQAARLEPPVLRMQSI